MKFENSFVLNTCVDDVWNFYTHTNHLNLIAPPQIHLKVVSSTSSQLRAGVLVTMSARYLFFQKTWKPEITYSENFKYVDEMIIGPFHKWIHTHIFVELSASKTKVNDNIDFELPFYSGVA